MNYDYVGYFIKNYLWGVNELFFIILRYIFLFIKKIKYCKKLKIE